MTQHSINFGNTLKQEGMKRSLESAERANPGWGDIAFKFLCEFIEKTRWDFQTEEVREASKGIVPIPAHGRAWGSIVSKSGKGWNNQEGRL